jgi:maltose alpha-D-glucosyltransferase/alpha-amylase
MHLALASDKSAPEFAPQPLTTDDMRELEKEIEFQAQQALPALGQRIGELPAEIAPSAKRLFDQGQQAVARFKEISVSVPQAVKTRVHGDYHLGQVLWVDNDYVILDFEGEPTRTIDERREKFSPIRDVAGMLRSYHYAAYAGLFSFTQDRPGDFERLEPWANLWQQWVSAAFLSEYLRTTAGAPLVPQDAAEFSLLLDRFTLAKALYELAYELNNRPDWVRIPLSGVTRLLGIDQPAKH